MRLSYKEKVLPVKSVCQLIANKKQDDSLISSLFLFVVSCRQAGKLASRPDELAAGPAGDYRKFVKELFSAC